MSDFFSQISNNEYTQLFLLILRMITPVIAAFTLWKCFTSFRKGLRRGAPVILLRDVNRNTIHKVLYWENSIGRSKTCDIVLENNTVSRDHAVLLRRKSGWYICDTGSTSGVYVNGKKIKERTLIEFGDVITLGKKELVLEDTEIQSDSKKKTFKGFTKKNASPFSLISMAFIVHFSMAFQLCIGTGEFKIKPFLLFLGICFTGCIFYLITIKAFKRTSFEIETIGFLLSGIGIMLISGQGVEYSLTQFFAFIAGLFAFCFLISFMSNADTVTKWRLFFAIIAIMLFVLNMAIGTEKYGAKNWIYIGGVSIQPSELIKIAFIIVGASTLDKLQTRKNIGEFIAFTAICLGFLFIMRDFGSACIFFVAFIIIAFMRSGSIRTIALICAIAVLGVIMIIYFKPYVAQRFAGWGNVWEHINDSLGYQQTRVLTYIASGGLFGIGLGRGCLHYVAAGDSDLVFGMICEEQGLLMGLVIVFGFVLITFIVMSDVKRSRSTFYSIASCATAGVLLFQACLNIFGSTDLFPLTGVTLPFISSGGSSMVAVWAMLAFIKSSDERTYRIVAKKGGGKS